MSDFFLASTAPANLLSYEEVLFMRAEAAARGYNAGGTAASFYDAGIFPTPSASSPSVCWFSSEHGYELLLPRTYLTGTLYDNIGA